MGTHKKPRLIVSFTKIVTRSQELLFFKVSTQKSVETFLNLWYISLSVSPF